jgi:glucokinase-like ROK family protein
MGINVTTMKSRNLQAILWALLRNEHVSRVRLADITSLSTTTITNLITDLLEQGIVVEEGAQIPEDRRGAGRPRTLLRLVPEARFAVGIHIGVGSVRIALVDLRANSVGSRTLAHPLDRSPQKVFAETADVARTLLQQTGTRTDQIVGVGVGASGLVNPSTGVNVMAPNLGWRDVPIVEWLSDQLHLPVRVDNNVRAMALGEAMFGAGRDVRALALVYGRIGVGAGFVVDNQLYQGSAAGAGEIGHNTIIPDGGEPCRCGNTGCLETLVSEPSIVRSAESLAQHRPDGLLATYLREHQGPPIERIFAAARAGDAHVCTLLNQRAQFLGIALANLVNVLNPELIVFGGIFAQAHDILAPTIQETIRRRAFADLGERVQLRTATFGRQAGATGAAALALSAFFYQQNGPVTRAIV